jgi:hypothetical protein
MEKSLATQAIVVISLPPNRVSTVIVVMLLNFD